MELSAYARTAFIIVVPESTAVMVLALVSWRTFIKLGELHTRWRTSGMLTPFSGRARQEYRDSCYRTRVHGLGFGREAPAENFVVGRLIDDSDRQSGGRKRRSIPLLEHSRRPLKAIDEMGCSHILVPICRGARNCLSVHRHCGSPWAGIRGRSRLTLSSGSAWR